MITITQTREVRIERRELQLLVDVANGGELYETTGGPPRGVPHLMDAGLLREGTDPRGSEPYLMDAGLLREGSDPRGAVRRYYFLTEAGRKLVNEHCNRIERWEIK